MTASVLDTSRNWRAPARAGYDASAEATMARVLPLLATERVAWLSTVRPDGLPHLVPTWFWWDGEALLVYSKPDAVKVRNLRANPRLMVALGDPDDDFAVGLIEAEAQVVPGAAEAPAAFFAKYASELSRGTFDPAGFRSLNRQAIRIVPTRFLAWHGRGPVRQEPHAIPASAAPAQAGARADGMAARLFSALDRLAARIRVPAFAPVPGPG